MSYKTIGGLPVIDRKYIPQVSMLNRFYYWAFYAIRYYLIGGKHGNFGSPNWQKMRVKLEDRIFKESENGDEGKYIDVPIISSNEITPEKFQNIYIKTNTPLVIRPMAHDWKAISEWSPEFFKKTYGDTIIPVRITGKETGGEYKEMVTIDEMTVKKLVNNLRSGCDFYGSNMTNLWYQHEELWDYLNIELIESFSCTKKAGPLSKLLGLELFMGGADTITPFHCSGTVNLFIQVYGKKKWTFIDPRHSLWMSPIARSDALFAGSVVNFKDTHDDIEKAGFPLYRFIPKYTVTLEPGDVLFSPPWWWHAIENPEASIGIATRAIGGLFYHNLFSAMWACSGHFRKVVKSQMKLGRVSDELTGAKHVFIYKKGSSDDSTKKKPDDP